MALRFIIGRAGAGKSERCLDEIRGCLRERPDGNPLIVLVPEQATFQTEYALVTAPGLTGVMRAQVLSFRRLAFRILQETGGIARIHIDDPGKKMLLYRILQQRKDELIQFGGAADGKMGFIDKLNELYKEFVRYNVTSDMLHDHLRMRESGGRGRTAALSDKMHDIALVYRDFEHELSRHYLDSEHYLTHMAERIGEARSLCGAEVWLDGFHGFTPQEYAVIEQLLIHTSGVTAALCLDKAYGAGERPAELDLFHPTATTMIQLRQLAEKHGIGTESVLNMSADSTAGGSDCVAGENGSGTSAAVPPRFRQSPALAYLERHFDDRAAWRKDRPAADDRGRPIDAAAGISLHAAVNRRAEVEAAAREIRRLVRDRGCRYRDIAVMVRNMEDYRDLLAAVWADYDIPFFFDHKRTTLHHPIIEFIRSALEVVSGNWRHDAVFRCVKTELLFPLDQTEDEVRTAMDKLENYALRFGIQGAAWTKPQPWTYRQTPLLEEDDTPETGAVAELERINGARSLVVGPLLRFQQQIRLADDARGMTEALYMLLEYVRAEERMQYWQRLYAQRGDPEKAREHGQMWGAVIHLMDEIVEVIGGEQVSMELFTGIVQTGLESIKLGLVPPSLDQIIVGTVDRTRSGRLQYIFILGVNDGVIPARVREEGVLSEPEREMLHDSGLELAPGSRRRLLDEQFVIYTTLAAPEKHLWVSYPLADEEGRTLLPSEVFRRIGYIFPQLAGRTDMLPAEPDAASAQADQLQYVEHPARTLSYLLTQLQQWKRGTALDDLWRRVYDWYCGRPDWREKLATLLPSLFYTNRESKLRLPTSRMLYGQHLKVSVSRMEKFAACPFSHFISHGLRLQERKMYRLEAPDIGQLFHAALSMIAVQLQEDNRAWGSLDAEHNRILAEQAVDRLSPRLQSEILLSSQRFGYIARKLKDTVGRAAVVLGEHASRSGFAPVAVELDFGEGKRVPPLVIRLDNGCTLEVIGRIDRIDMADIGRTTHLRVLDYKSSRTELSLPKVAYGLSLQMLVYLDVAVTHAEKWLGRQAAPAGVLYFHVHHPIVQTDGAVPPDKARDELFRRYKMKGLISADREVVQQMDTKLVKGHSDMIPAALKADGSFYSHSSVVSGRQWEELRKYVRNSVKKIGAGITDGNVEIAPYRFGPNTACTHCSYKSVCQFDAQMEGNVYRVLPSMDKAAAWKLLEQDEKTTESLLNT